MALRSDDWTRVRELFERALALPGSERAAYLANACGADQALRDEVARMLESHDGAAGFLSTPAAVMLDPVATASLEGQRIGPYLLGARIGVGGMGEVYKARDTRLDRTVAIKVLPPDVVHDTQARERFVREGRAIAALNHPNICALYDVGDTSGGDSPKAGSTLFLVMEHLEGETLADCLARGPMPALQALKVGAQIASALDRAHRAGIVHRDLKPGNIFLVRSGASGAPTAKLLDFGLAKALAPPPAETAATRHAIAASLTVPGMIIGTVQYHGAGASRGARSRRAHGRLCIRRGVARNADWRESVRWEESGEPDCGNPRTRSGAGLSACAVGAARHSIASSGNAWRKIPTTAGKAPRISQAKSTGSRRAALAPRFRTPAIDPHVWCGRWRWRPSRRSPPSRPLSSSVGGASRRFHRHPNDSSPNCR